MMKFENEAVGNSRRFVFCSSLTYEYEYIVGTGTELASTIVVF